MLCLNMNVMSFEPSHHYIFRVKYKAKNGTDLEFRQEYYQDDVFLAVLLGGDDKQRREIVKVLRKLNILKRKKDEPTQEGLQWIKEVIDTAKRKCYGHTC